MRQYPDLFSHPLYLTDGGLETTLIFQQGIELRSFAAFELMNSEKGKQALIDYIHPYLQLAAARQLPFVLETPTWRANPDWGEKLGYDTDALTLLNKTSVKFMRQQAAPYGAALPQLIVSGNIGPRGDGYQAINKMDPDTAMEYHIAQVQAFAMADADVVTALTLTYSDEAIGIIRAAQRCGLPVVIAFTVETDGKLPGGETIGEAITATDNATDAYAQHFMINCAHPQHFVPALQQGGEWLHRIRGIRANASSKSHAELDESTTLDAGDQQLLATGYKQLQELLPALQVIGGCCGTDHTHLHTVCNSLLVHKPTPS